MSGQGFLHKDMTIQFECMMFTLLGLVYESHWCKS